MKIDRTLLIPCLLMALCFGAFFLIFLPPTLVDTGGMSRFTSYDLHSFFLPKFVYGSRELAHGRLPLWNRYEFGGIPFLATAQPAVLYPPKALLFAVLSEDRAFWTFLILHYVVLAVGFLFSLREQGIVGLPAFAGTATWTFSVPVLLSNYHPIRIANLAFVAPCFLLVDRIGRGANAKKAAAWLVVVLALQFPAGDPESTLALA